jgi:hypothetical protein
LQRGAAAQRARAAALEAGDVHLDRRLGEGEEVRAQAHLALGAEDRAAKASSVPLRSASVMSSSTHRPSTWWNCGVCVASESRR